LELRFDGRAAFEPLRRLWRREEHRRVLVEGSSKDVPIEILEGRQESGERRAHRRTRGHLRRCLSLPRIQSDGGTNHADDEERHRAFHGVDISRAEAYGDASNVAIRDGMVWFDYGNRCANFRSLE